MNYITDSFIHIKTIIGTETKYKSLTLEHDKYVFPIQFLDLKSFLAEGDLDKYSTKFAVDTLNSNSEFNIKLNKQKEYFLTRYSILKIMFQN
jgi:hypothetical protein